VARWPAGFISNRLKSVEPVFSPVAGSKKLEFAYDYMNRRVQKKVSTWNGTASPAIPDSDTRFVSAIKKTSCRLLPR
jgi:hypothetical protein